MVADLHHVAERARDAAPSASAMPSRPTALAARPRAPAEKRNAGDAERRPPRAPQGQRRLGKTRIANGVANTQPNTTATSPDGMSRSAQYTPGGS